MSEYAIKRDVFLRDLEDGNLTDDKPNNHIPNAIVISRERELFYQYKNDQMPMLETTKIACFSGIIEERVTNTVGCVEHLRCPLRGYLIV